MRSSRALSSVGTLALLLGLCASTSTLPATAVAEELTPEVTSAQEAERLLRADATAPVTVSTGSDGVADFVGTLGAPVPGPAMAATATPVQAAGEHLERYGAMFGVEQPEAQLEATAVVDAAAGSHLVKFGQQVDGVPVIGGELVVSVDPHGDLESVNGETTDRDVAVPAPAETSAAAARTAVRTTARTHRVRPGTLTAGAASRWFYDPELVGSADPLGPRPVWRVEVSDGAGIRELVLIDTTTGGVAAHVNQVADAKVRVVCNRRLRNDDETPCTRAAYARTETSGAAGDRDVESAFQYAGHTWDLFRALGRDLTGMIGHNAGDGRKLRLTANLPGKNAFWNGREVYFSRGFALADDVVAHELSHGVIERLSGLMYWYQSGAINESMADVFGELVDQRNGVDRTGQPDQRSWLLGEDAPGGTIRDMRTPTRVVQVGPPRQPDRMRSRFYFADAQLQDNGGVHINSGVGNKAAFLIAAGGRFNGQTVRGIDANRSSRTKTARIYLRVLPMLTSASDYADLGRLLPQACRTLIGRGTPAVTASDCAQVRRAVVATQMLRQPRRAQAPEAPTCTPRSARSRHLFFDNMERTRSRAWDRGPLWTRVPRPRLQLPRYATSGRRSLFGRDPDPSVGGPRQSALTLRRVIRVPRGPRTYLRFDHARLFEHNFRRGRAARFFDGGRVEYSTDRGRSWSNTARLRWDNGPRQRIDTGNRRFRGFGGDSHGYVSSRLNLSRFGGRAVRLRWTVRGDRTVGFLGWWLDDIEVYTCARGR